MTTLATRSRRLRIAIGATLAATASLALTAGALAQSSSVDGYAGAGGDRTSTVDQVTGSGLPFTGLDLWMLGGAGLGLLAIGLGVRWLSGRSPSTPTGV